MIGLNQEIERRLRPEVDFIHVVDITSLDFRQNRGMPYAILIGIAINPLFLKNVLDNPNYVHTLEDEYAQTENKAGTIADELAVYLRDKGYAAFSQSDKGLLEENAFDFATKTSVLPHKTIAMLSGLGWIGKNNLFITSDYGAAQCLGSVLTDAPLTVSKSDIPSSRCGKCTICVKVCSKKALKGQGWSRHISRDDMINVYDCVTCLRCMACCPVTQRYIKQHGK